MANSNIANNDNSCQSKKSTYSLNTFNKERLLFQQLNQLIENLETLEIGDHHKSQAEKFLLPLSLEIIDKNKKENTLTLSITHYYEQNGDLVPDPDVTVRINWKWKTAEGLTFQNSIFYSQVFSEDRTQYKPKIKDHLNEFLGNWLDELAEYGYKNLVLEQSIN